jgi:hypothetical protein
MWKAVLGNCDPKREVVVDKKKEACDPFGNCPLRSVSAVFSMAFPINDDEE